MRLLPCGDAAVLVEVDGAGAVLALAGRLAAEPPEGVVDVVPAATTVLVRIDRSRTDLAAVGRAVRRAAADPAAPREGPAVEIPVTYDGADLEEVGERTGLGPRGVVAAHTGQRWRVAFVGFAPGFGYLLGEDDRLAVPRRAEPRVRVPAGAVGLAGPYSGVYPRPSPGGWQLIGRTALDLWDLARDPPALLAPGTAVRFREVR